MWGLLLSIFDWLGLSPTPFIAESVGATDPAIKLFLSILMGYPIGSFYHKYVMDKSTWIRNLYFVVTGLDMAWYNFGTTMYHNAVPAIVMYLSTLYLGPSKANCIVTFAFNMTYLLVGYVLTESEDYDITWTMPHCVLTLKLIALSFDLWDGDKMKNGEELSANNKKTALLIAPTLPEIIGFVYFPACFLVGPIFSFKRYHEFIEDKYPLETNKEVFINQAFTKLLQGVLYVLAHQIGVAVFNVKYMQSDDFWETSIFYRHLYVGLWAHFVLYKYISCWLLTEVGTMPYSILGIAQDWILLMDTYEKHYSVPEDLAVTVSRPEIFLYSRQLKHVLLVELTIPWEVNIPKDHNLKLNKYHEIYTEIARKGLKVHLYAVEVGARGVPVKSFYSLLTDIGLPRTAVASLLERASKTALSSSYSIWLSRERGESSEGER